MNFNFARYDAPVMPEPVSAGADDVANGVTDKKDGPVKMRSEMCVRKEGPIDCIAPYVEGLDFLFKPKLTLDDDEKPPEPEPKKGGTAGGFGGGFGAKPAGGGAAFGGGFGKAKPAGGGAGFGGAFGWGGK